MDYQQQVCSRCGKPITNGSQFCSCCGTPVQSPVNNNYQQNYQITNNSIPPMQQPIKPPPGLSKKEFMNNYSPEFNKNIKTSVFIGYVCTGISALLLIPNIIIGIGRGMITTSDSILSFIMIVPVICFLLGLHLSKSKVCAIALLMSNIVYTMVGLFVFGRITGILIFVASISAVLAFFKLDKQYKQYLLETSVPQPVNNQQFNNYNNRQN